MRSQSREHTAKFFDGDQTIAEMKIRISTARSHEERGDPVFFLFSSPRLRKIDQTLPPLIYTERPLREQFLYPHKKKTDSADSQTLAGDVPKLVLRETGVATEKKDPKGIADQMPESAKAFLRDPREPLVRHEASGQIEKPPSENRSLRSEQKAVIWHLTGSGRGCNQVCLGRTEVSQTLDCRIDFRGRCRSAGHNPLIFQNLRSRRRLTTSHLFWPNERRKRAFLPIRVPNPSFLGGKMQQARPRGGRG
jgi:hypothetical protein